LSRAGYKVRTAEGGAKGMTLAKSARPDLILLDYLMPGLNGDEVCRALGQDPTLRDVPVIVMSARAEKMGARLIDDLGAVDFISKPFSPEALVAVTSHAIEKYVREGTPPPRLGQTPEPGAVPVRPGVESLERPQILGRARADLVERLAPALEEALAKLPAGADAQARRTALEHAVGTSLAEPVLSDLAGTLLQAFPERDLEDGVALRGDLSRVAVADVLQMMYVQKQTGVLVVERGDVRIEIHFREGHVDWVGGRNLREEFLLGRFIVDRGAISRQDLDLFLQSRTGTRKLLGAQLVKLGYITPEELSASLRQQSSEIIYDTLRWQSGRFLLRRTEERPAHVAEASLNLAVEQLLMEGFRRVDEWSLIERVIHSFDIVFQRNDDAILAFGVDALQPEEAAMLDLVDGESSVRDIVERSRMGSFPVCQILYRLLSARLIRKRVEPAPPEVLHNA
jgi:CheY-like chemotaxis protein